jgi:transcriptional adapter 2-alpha
MLNIYHSVLIARGERKKIIFDRNLVDFKKIMLNEKKRSKEEKDLLARIRAFARLQTREDFDQFADGMLEEIKLRQKIAQLQEYRRMGVTTHEQAKEYDKAKEKKTQTKTSSFGFDRAIPKRDKVCKPNTEFTRSTIAVVFVLKSC